MSVELNAGQGLALRVLPGGYDEQLLERRHCRAREVTDDLGAVGNLSPTEDVEVFFLGNLFDGRLFGLPFSVIQWQKSHPDGVATFGR